MKNYFAEYSNGDCDFFKATTDNKAYVKACKMAKQVWSEVVYLAEVEVDEDDELTGEDRVIIKNGKEV